MQKKKKKKEEHEHDFTFFAVFAKYQSTFKAMLLFKKKKHAHIKEIHIHLQIILENKMKLCHA